MSQLRSGDALVCNMFPTLQETLRAGNRTCLKKINLVFHQFEKNHLATTTTFKMAERKSKFSPEIVEIAKRFPTKSYEFNYNFKDVILYNMAIGASVRDNDDLR